MRAYLKKISTLAALVFITTSCTAIRHIKKVSKISADRAVKECTEPIEYYFISPTSYGIEVRLMRHENCMGIPDMLMIIWAGEKTELNETIIKVITLMYINSLNFNNEKQLGRIFLKYDKIEDGPYIKFYELVEAGIEDRENDKVK